MLRKKNRALISSALTLTIALASGGCGKASETGTSGSTTYLSSGGNNNGGVNTATLSLSPSMPTVSPGGTITLFASGGIAPYTYFIRSGGGTINSTSATYTAPLLTGAVSLGVQDSDGVLAYASINVSGSATATLTVLPATTTIALGGSVTFSASGGVAPYSFQVTSGGGSFNGSIYTAPAASGTAQIRALDSTGKYGTATINIGAATALTLSPSTLTVNTGSTTTFSASGGVAPYTYSVSSGGGSFSGANYTASGAAGTAVVQVRDNLGSTATATVTVQATYSTATISGVFALRIDHFAGISFNNVNGTDSPTMTIFGSGPSANSSAVAQNCSAPSATGVPTGCAQTFTLTNFSNSQAAGVSYRGSVLVQKRDGSLAASLNYCISPSARDRAYIKTFYGTSVYLLTNTFDYPGLSLFNGATATAYYTAVDSEGGAGNHTITWSGAFSTYTNCGDFDQNYYVRVQP